jgi:hypothetical protein
MSYGRLDAAPAVDHQRFGSGCYENGVAERLYRLLPRLARTSDSHIPEYSRLTTGITSFMAASSSSSALTADDGSQGTNLFDDVFEVLQVNPEGKKFEKGEE